MVGFEDGFDQIIADSRSESLHKFTGVLRLLIERESHAEAEFSIVFEEGIGPGRAAAIAVGGPGSRWQIATVDGGATGGVADNQALAEQLA